MLLLDGLRGRGRRCESHFRNVEGCESGFRNPSSQPRHPAAGCRQDGNVTHGSGWGPWLR
ncbi:hypothetical protein DMC64_28765 [Amycolatopsis sp. WAC 04197]|nr:hypothetical protein DMC64_28765 [Amycolatopsis sp. WAC 04197]